MHWPNQLKISVLVWFKILCGIWYKKLDVILVQCRFKIKVVLDISFNICLFDCIIYYRCIAANMMQLSCCLSVEKPLQWLTFKRLVDLLSSTLGINQHYTVIITELVGLLTLWIVTENHVCSWKQCICSRRSACHMCGGHVDICAHMSGITFTGYWQLKKSLTIPAYLVMIKV